MNELPPTAEEIRELPYVELLALMRESNRPPGGIDTARRFVVNCHLRPGINLLHAGCSTGFLSRELARLSGCSVLGIDISEAMVNAANKRAVKENLSHLVKHERHDMRTMHLEGRCFDVVLSGGALAFVRDHRKAVEQWLQIVTSFGLLADAELYYRDVPPQHILDEVSAALGVLVPCYEHGYWESVFEHELLEPYYRYENAIKVHSDAEVQSYCERMIAFSAADWNQAAKEALYERLLHLFTLFNENLKYMNYTVLVYRRVPEGAEPTLYV